MLFYNFKKVANSELFKTFLKAVKGQNNDTEFVVIFFISPNIHFWRTATGNEIDFIINENYISGKAYEVKFSSNKINTNKYKKFITIYPDFEFQFISYNFDETGVSIPALKL